MMAFCPEHPERDQNPKFTPLSETTSISTTFICGVSPTPGCIVPASMEVELIVGSLPFFGRFFPGCRFPPSRPLQKLTNIPNSMFNLKVRKSIRLQVYQAVLGTLKCHHLKISLVLTKLIRAFT